MWAVLIVVFLVCIDISKAGEPVERARINAPGQLEVDYFDRDTGIIHEVYTVVLTVNEPHFCDIKGEPRYMWFFFEGLMVEKDPVQSQGLTERK